MAIEMQFDKPDRFFTATDIDVLKELDGASASLAETFSGGRDRRSSRR